MLPRSRAEMRRGAAPDDDVVTISRAEYEHLLRIRDSVRRGEGGLGDRCEIAPYHCAYARDPPFWCDFCRTTGGRPRAVDLHTCPTSPATCPMPMLPPSTRGARSEGPR